MALQKKYTVFGIIGCLCFGIGDWLLGYVNPASVGEDVFYFIREGHGMGYDLSKAAVTLVLAMVGMCFLYPGFVHISDIADNEDTKHSQAEQCGGRELALALSAGLGNAGMGTLCVIFLLIGVPLLKLIIDILRRKTCLKRTAVFFSPIVPMAVIFVAAQLLPQSPFSYGLYTFCMNGGMLVWFVYLLTVNWKG